MLLSVTIFLIEILFFRCIRFVLPLNHAFEGYKLKSRAKLLILCEIITFFCDFFAKKRVLHEKISKKWFFSHLERWIMLSQENALR